MRPSVLSSTPSACEQKVPRGWKSIMPQLPMSSKRHSTMLCAIGSTLAAVAPCTTSEGHATAVLTSPYLRGTRQLSRLLQQAVLGGKAAELAHVHCHLGRIHDPHIIRSGLWCPALHCRVVGDHGTLRCGTLLMRWRSVLGRSHACIRKRMHEGRGHAPGGSPAPRTRLCSCWWSSQTPAPS
jgi:hypothetical protein